MWQVIALQSTLNNLRAVANVENRSTLNKLEKGEQKELSGGQHLKLGNIHMLQAVFLPQCRETLKIVMACLSRKKPPPQEILRKHWQQTLIILEQTHNSGHDTCDPARCWNHNKPFEVPEIDWSEFIEELFLNRLHLICRADFVLGKVKVYIDREEEQLEKWDAMTDEEQDAEKTTIAMIASNVAAKIDAAESRKRNGQKGNDDRASGAKERLQEAYSTLKARGETITNAALAKEGKLSRATVRKYMHLLKS